MNIARKDGETIPASSGLYGAAGLRGRTSRLAVCPQPVMGAKPRRRPTWPAFGRADHRVGESLVSVLDQTGKAEVENLLAHDDYIQAVRRVRELIGLRLVDARRLVDSLKT